jgi:hypothetical protein
MATMLYSDRGYLNRWMLCQGRLGRALASENPRRTMWVGCVTESRTTIAGDPFYREWLCGAGQGCRGRILERLYIDNCFPLTVELFRSLPFSF